MEEKACRNCRLVISHGDTCPSCGSKDLTTKWSGYAIVINAEKSSIAKIAWSQAQQHLRDKHQGLEFQVLI
jgi:RNA polymerase subunit RPABC4/transcription elongation factor Spt4